METDEQPLDEFQQMLRRVMESMSEDQREILLENPMALKVALVSAAAVLEYMESHPD